MKDLDADILWGVFPVHPDMPDAHYHTPIMTKQVKACLQPAPGMLFLDGTAGGGGHTRLLAEAGAEVIALDQDPEALEACGRNLAGFESRVRLANSNFRNAADALASLGETRALNGVLLDIGVSSHQLDQAERGFSFQSEGPLDMRMAKGEGQTAADLVNNLPVKSLEEIFTNFGEEPQARRIASHIVARRAQRPLQTTRDLAEAVLEVVPKRGPKHPATKVFQALRIAVNDELGALRQALQSIPPLLAPGARLAVITFHSLEDRIVKVFFREHSREWIDRPEWPRPKRNPDRQFHLLTPHPITPSEGEMQRNPRSRSAKLRVVEKLPNP